MWRAPEGPQGQAAAPVGGGGAWPDNEPTHPATRKRHSTADVEGAGGTAGPGCGTRGRRRGLAGQRADAPSNISDMAPLVWRAPEGPEGTGGLRGAAPNEVRRPSLAGGRGLRRPEHPWGHKQQHTGTNGERAGRRQPAHTAAGPHKATQEPLNGIAKGAGISRPLARVPSLIHEGHLDATHQRGDDVVEHGSQRR